jgi:hypothetical protein
MLFLSVFATPAAALVNKKPAIDLAIAGFSKFYDSCLEVPSHDAVMASGAMPHGRLASDSLVANANLSSRDHLLTTAIKADGRRIVNPWFTQKRARGGPNPSPDPGGESKKQRVLSWFSFDGT